MAGKKGKSGRKPGTSGMAPRNIVYQITHIPSGRVYIGSTQHTLAYRMAIHRSRPIKELQVDLAQNGWDDFEVTVIGHYPDHTREELYKEERNALTQCEALGISTYNTRTPGNTNTHDQKPDRKWTPEQKAHLSRLTKQRIAEKGRNSTRKLTHPSTRDLAVRWGWEHTKVLAYLALLEIPLRHTSQYIAKPEGLNHSVTVQVKVAADPENFPLPTNPPDLSSMYPQYKGGNNGIR